MFPCRKRGFEIRTRDHVCEDGAPKKHSRYPLESLQGSGLSGCLLHLKDSLGLEHRGVIIRKSDNIEVELISDVLVAVDEVLLSPDKVVRARQAHDRMFQAIPKVYDQDMIVRAVNAKLGSQSTVGAPDLPNGGLHGCA